MEQPSEGISSCCAFCKQEELCPTVLQSDDDRDATVETRGRDTEPSEVCICPMLEPCLESDVCLVHTGKELL